VDDIQSVPIEVTKEDIKSRPHKIPGLTVKQSIFVESYVVTSNAKEAAICAGVPEKSAASYGWQLLKNHKILTALDAYRAKLRNVVTKESYIDKALDTFERLEITEPNSPRFYDIAGRALGYIGNTNTPTTVNNVQINVNEVKIMSPGEKWNALRSLLENE